MRFRLLLRPLLLLVAWATGCTLSHNPDLPSGEHSGDGDGDMATGTGGAMGDGDGGAASEDAESVSETALGGAGGGL